MNGRKPTTRSCAARWLTALLACGSAAAGDVTFVVYGDSRADGTTCAGNEIHQRLIERMSALPAAFVANTGDMITGFAATTNFNSDGICATPRGRGSLKELIRPIQSRQPPPGVPSSFIPVIGNHDDNWGNKWYPDPMLGVACDTFDLARLVPNHTRKPYFRSLKRTMQDADFAARLCSPSDRSVYPAYAYYSFRHDDVHFVVLRINNNGFSFDACTRCRGVREDYDDYYNMHQLHFLEADLAQARRNPRTRAIFVLLHAPVLSSSNHPGVAAWKTLGEVFTRHRVTAAFSGHNHVYERSHPMAFGPDAPEGRRDDRAGTVYVTTGGGGAPLHELKPRQPSWSAARLATYHYVVVTLPASGGLELRAVDLDGRTFDTFRR